MGGLPPRQSQRNRQTILSNGRRGMGRSYGTLLRTRLELHDVEFQACHRTFLVGTFQLRQLRRSHVGASKLQNHEQGRDCNDLGKTQLRKLCRQHVARKLHNTPSCVFQHKRQRQPFFERNQSGKKLLYPHRREIGVRGMSNIVGQNKLIVI